MDSAHGFQKYIQDEITEIKKYIESQGNPVGEERRRLILLWITTNSEPFRLNWGKDCT